MSVFGMDGSLLRRSYLFLLWFHRRSNVFLSCSLILCGLFVVCLYRTSTVFHETFLPAKERCMHGVCRIRIVFPSFATVFTVVERSFRDTVVVVWKYCTAAIYEAIQVKGSSSNVSGGAVRAVRAGI